MDAAAEQIAGHVGGADEQHQALEDDLSHGGPVDLAVGPADAPPRGDGTLLDRGAQCPPVGALEALLGCAGGLCEQAGCLAAETAGGGLGREEGDGGHWRKGVRWIGDQPRAVAVLKRLIWKTGRSQRGQRRALLSDLSNKTSPGLAKRGGWGQKGSGSSAGMRSRWRISSRTSSSSSRSWR